MAKQKLNGAHTKNKGPVEISFTNSTGDSFKLLPINPLEEQIIKDQVQKEWLANGRAIPKAPVLHIKNAAGDDIEVVLKSEKDADTPELVEQWKQYKADDQELQVEFSTRFMTSLFLCVDAKPADHPGWFRRMKLLKIAIPEDEDEAFLLFVQDWVIRSKDDLADFIFTVTSSAIAMNEEARAAAEAAFRSQMERAYSAAVAQN